MKRKVVLCTKCGEPLQLPIMRWIALNGKLVEIHEHIVCPNGAQEEREVAAG